MTSFDFEWIEDHPLSEFIDISLIGEPNETLADLSGFHDRLGPDDLRTFVTETIDEAWHCPIRSLTCGHFRMLLSQRMGFEWVAEAIAEFVALHPKVLVTNYEGEMSLLALKALTDIEEVNPEAARRLRSLDYSWMHEQFAYDEDLQQESADILRTILN